jgi:hypothetical protein
MYRLDRRAGAPGHGDKWKGPCFCYRSPMDDQRCSSSFHRTIIVQGVDLRAFGWTNYDHFNRLNARFRILTLFSNGSTQENTEKWTVRSTDSFSGKTFELQQLNVCINDRSVGNWRICKLLLYCMLATSWQHTGIKISNFRVYCYQ